MAKSQLELVVKQYADLERRVQRLMNAACASTCAACAKVCCRPEMCRESLESPFLIMVRTSGSNGTFWNKSRGWLGPKGCRLHAGRPPVCYEFLCQDILANQPDENSRTQLKALAYVLTQMGRRALGSDHLVEIMTQERLARLGTQRLAVRLDRAEASLLEQESF